MWVNRVFCLFIIYSLMGWIYETVFCTIKGKKWENRGFLYGPVCPLYGVGALIVTGIVEMIKKSGAEPQAWMIFVVSVIGSAILVPIVNVSSLVISLLLPKDLLLNMIA